MGSKAEHLVELIVVMGSKAGHLVELIVVGVVVWGVVQLLCGAYDRARVTNNRNGDGTSSNS